jgi:hypothetical protein
MLGSQRTVGRCRGASGRGAARHEPPAIAAQPRLLATLGVTWAEAGRRLGVNRTSTLTTTTRVGPRCGGCLTSDHMRSGPSTTLTIWPRPNRKEGSDSQAYFSGQISTHPVASKRRVNPRQVRRSLTTSARHFPTSVLASMCFILQRSSRAEEFLSQSPPRRGRAEAQGPAPRNSYASSARRRPLLPGRPPVLGAENELLGAPFGLGIARRRYCPIGGAGRQLHYAPTHRTVTDGHHE